MDLEARRHRNEEFVKRLMKRRPQERPVYDRALRAPAAIAETNLESAPEVAEHTRDWVLETIVSRERPVLFIKNGQFDTTDVTTLGNEAVELVAMMKAAGPKLTPLLPLIGRIDVTNFPGLDFVGTGWFVDREILVTNRHVAKLLATRNGAKFVFSRGVANQPLVPSWCNAHEYDDLNPDASRVFKVKEVLYIEPDSGPNDIAFVRVERRVESNTPPHIPIAASDIKDDEQVCVIGYPARAPRRIIPDQGLMQELFRGRFDVKRAAPGLGLGTSNGSSEHDCSTLGGNSGSVVVNLKGEAVGLHYAGLYMEANYAVPASVLNEYIRRRRWSQAIPAGGSDAAQDGSENLAPADQSATNTSPNPTTVAKPSTSVVRHQVAASPGDKMSLTIPLTITIEVGAATDAAAVSSGPSAGKPEASRIDEAVKNYWAAKPEGVLAARVGFVEEGEEIGEQPCIAASVIPQRWSEFESTGLKEFQGVPVRYFPADVAEQVESHPALESVDSIAYDDDARDGERFSFAPVKEQMEVTLHVGPEYSWEVLQGFIEDAEGDLVLGIYEFHAAHLKDALEARLEDGVSLRVVMDNSSFIKVRDPQTEFDRVEVFEDWAERFDFHRVVAPEGKSGLISDAYHIKVLVRSDNRFWLSSGNWKASSSQPIITQPQRDNAADVDLPGNREWHVVVKNKTLASRFRNHLRQDFKRSVKLGGRELPKSKLAETFVDVPVEETVVLERRPPSRILEPKTISRKINVRYLLTPDNEGAVFSEAVLELIRSAKKSLLFQIPYIGMPSNPREDRGFIDELISALVDKLTSLEDGRVLLRSQGSNFSSPTHAAWFFKSKGVDLRSQVRMIENHHTKGMIVDGKRVLIGSQNWSKPGVTLNRDASLLFDDVEIAQYYAEAFEIDWERSVPIKPRRFVREAPILEAVGVVPPPGYRRVALSELLEDD